MIFSGLGSLLPITKCFPIPFHVTASEQKAIEAQRLINIQKVLDELPERQALLDKMELSAERTLTYDEFERLDVAIKAKLDLEYGYTGWHVERMLSAEIAKLLIADRLIVLPKPPPPPLHDYKPAGRGMKRLDSMEREIKFKKEQRD